MVKTTYIYFFNELSGKPKRFIESQKGCTVKGYGVSMDTVTLCVLYDSAESFNSINQLLMDKFKLVPKDIKLI
jgi:hypothetical protein